MAPAPACATPSWPPSPRGSRSAASPLLRYQFPYMERGSKRPDPPHLAHAAVRAAVAAARQALPGLALIAGGKSFGGRMTSQAQARTPLPTCADWPFSAFRYTRPASRRASAASIFSTSQIPMLFLQGTRDTLAMLDQIEPVCQALGARATLKLFADADHSFHVPARSGRKDAQVLGDVLDTLAGWTGDLSMPRRRPQPERQRDKAGAPTATRHHTNSVKPWRVT